MTPNGMACHDCAVFEAERKQLHRSIQLLKDQVAQADDAWRIAAEQAQETEKLRGFLSSRDAIIAQLRKEIADTEGQLSAALQDVTPARSELQIALEELTVLRQEKYTWQIGKDAQEKTVGQLSEELRLKEQKLAEQIGKYHDLVDKYRESCAALTKLNNGCRSYEALQQEQEQWDRDAALRLNFKRRVHRLVRFCQRLCDQLERQDLLEPIDKRLMTRYVNNVANLDENTHEDAAICEELDALLADALPESSPTRRARRRSSRSQAGPSPKSLPPSKLDYVNADPDEKQRISRVKERVGGGEVSTVLGTGDISVEKRREEEGKPENGERVRTLSESSDDERRHAPVTSQQARAAILRQRAARMSENSSSEFSQPVPIIKPPALKKRGRPRKPQEKSWREWRRSMQDFLAAPVISPISDDEAREAGNQTSSKSCRGNSLTPSQTPLSVAAPSRDLVSTHSEARNEENPRVNRISGETPTSGTDPNEKSPKSLLASMRLTKFVSSGFLTQGSAENPSEVDSEILDLLNSLVNTVSGEEKTQNQENVTFSPRNDRNQPWAEMIPLGARLTRTPKRLMSLCSTKQNFKAYHKTENGETSPEVSQTRVRVHSGGLVGSPVLPAGPPRFTRGASRSESVERARAKLEPIELSGEEENGDAKTGISASREFMAELDVEIEEEKKPERPTLTESKRDLERMVGREARPFSSPKTVSTPERGVSVLASKIVAKLANMQQAAVQKSPLSKRMELDVDSLLGVGKRKSAPAKPQAVMKRAKLDESVKIASPSGQRTVRTASKANIRLPGAQKMGTRKNSPEKFEKIRKISPVGKSVAGRQNGLGKGTKKKVGRGRPKKNEVKGQTVSKKESVSSRSEAKRESLLDSEQSDSDIGGEKKAKSTFETPERIARSGISQTARRLTREKYLKISEVLPGMLSPLASPVVTRSLTKGQEPEKSVKTGKTPKRIRQNSDSSEENLVIDDGDDTIDSENPEIKPEKSPERKAKIIESSDSEDETLNTSLAIDETPSRPLTPDLSEQLSKLRKSIAPKSVKRQAGSKISSKKHGHFLQSHLSNMLRQDAAAHLPVRVFKDITESRTLAFNSQQIAEAIIASAISNSADMLQNLLRLCALRKPPPLPYFSRTEKLICELTSQLAASETFQDLNKSIIDAILDTPWEHLDVKQVCGICRLFAAVSQLGNNSGFGSQLGKFVQNILCQLPQHALSTILTLFAAAPVETKTIFDRSSLLRKTLSAALFQKADSVGRKFATAFECICPQVEIPEFSEAVFEQNWSQIVEKCVARKEPFSVRETPDGVKYEIDLKIFEQFLPVIRIIVNFTNLEWFLKGKMPQFLRGLEDGNLPADKRALLCLVGSIALKWVKARAKSEPGEINDILETLGKDLLLILSPHVEQSSPQRWPWLEALLNVGPLCPTETLALLAQVGLGPRIPQQLAQGLRLFLDTHLA